MYQRGLGSAVLLALNAHVWALPSSPNALSSIPVQVRQLVTSQAQQSNDENICGKVAADEVRECKASNPGSGPCCSKFGWCGSGPDYCEEGCQPEFGECHSKASHHHEKKCGPDHKNKKCDDDECCSSNGLCGTSENFCGIHCQPDFGQCSPPPAPLSDPVTGALLCGESLPECPWQQCCSQAGFCGSGKEYCSVPGNCQEAFGWCDSKDTPKGLNHTTDPRDLFGDVPYGRVIDKCTQPGVAALTFNDGPGEHTEAVLDILHKHNAKATFFLSGISNGKGPIDRTPQWIKVVKRMMMEGHQVGTHGWSHSNLTALSTVERKDEMYQNEIAISNIVGRYPTYMRAPYLACDNSSGCLTDMHDLGYHVASFNVDTGDWFLGNNFELMQKIVRGFLALRGENGSMISVHHESAASLPEMVNFTLNEVAAKGWKAVTLGECFGDLAEHWYRAPIWNAPASNSPDGCIVTDINFCGTIMPFDDEKSCKTSVDDCFKNLGVCWKVLGEKHISCIEYDNICRAHKTHCEECDDEECGIDKWTVKRW